jgi:peptidyl-prolyl cis-trans isomerase A (cyclophilin A)
VWRQRRAVKVLVVDSMVFLLLETTCDEPSYEIAALMGALPCGGGARTMHFGSFGMAVLAALVVLSGCAAETPVEETPEVVEAAEEAVKVTLSTAAGDIVLELYPERAPITVDNFVKHVDGGHFDGATFYRVVRPETNNGTETMQLIQGGLYGTAMAGQDAEIVQPFDPIAHETTEMSGIQHERGVISMARLDPGTAASEFFILVTEAPELDFGGMRNPDGQGFAAFGRVVEGMEVVEAIQQGSSDVPVEVPMLQGQILDEPVEIISATRG